ncbi:MAG TPA: hypothetical protein VGO11_14485 [Chthoniobacteraceae bacterium]|jgi:hypothetical protein|nr:hypothetical protein [Chthoniobacteraceae bacterium]
MSFAQLKEEAANLEPRERRELMAFLAARDTAGDEEFQKLLAEELDNKDPENWFTLDAARKKYAAVEAGE